MIAKISFEGFEFNDRLGETIRMKRIIRVRLLVGDELVKICGIAKGSGMIAPNLATMLSFIFTNADINSNLL